MDKAQYKVEVIARERGWGSEVLQTKYFKYLSQAKRFAHSVNKKNISPTAPDYYIQAEILKYNFSNDSYE